MAIIGAVIGGGAIVGIAATPSRDSYSDYHDYDNYSNYSNYSDAAERKRRRAEEKQREITQQTSTVDQYKITRINGHLKSQRLISMPGTQVSVNAVENDGYEVIKDAETAELSRSTEELRKEIAEIDRLLGVIDSVREEDSE